MSCSKFPKTFRFQWTWKCLNCESTYSEFSHIIHWIMMSWLLHRTWEVNSSRTPVATRILESSIILSMVPSKMLYIYKLVYVMWWCNLWIPYMTFLRVHCLVNCYRYAELKTLIIMLINLCNLAYDKFPVAWSKLSTDIVFKPKQMIKVKSPSHCCCHIFNVLIY